MLFTKKFQTLKDLHHNETFRAENIFIREIIWAIEREPAKTDFVLLKWWIMKIPLIFLVDVEYLKFELHDWLGEMNFTLD